MKNPGLTLMLIDKSINAFGKKIGQTKEEKWRTELSITRSTIHDSFHIDSVDLSKKILEELLAKSILSLEQVQQLSNLLWTQAELLLKLNRAQESLIQFKNVLQLLYWKEEQPTGKDCQERKNKINELKSIISTLKQTVDLK